MSLQDPGVAAKTPGTVPSSALASTGTLALMTEHAHATCNKCHQTLSDEGNPSSTSYVVSFGSSLWHVDCFRCVRCNDVVDHSSNLLFLSDGSLVCENCSYRCNVCNLLISDEAIMTGDDAYHAECFRCKSCSKKIEELVFAKTTQGIWCMSCHNERVARSRKHAENRRRRRQHTKKDESNNSPRMLKVPSSESSVPRGDTETVPAPSLAETVASGSDKKTAPLSLLRDNAPPSISLKGMLAPTLREPSTGTTSPRDIAPAAPKDDAPPSVSTANASLSVSSSSKANNRRSGFYGFFNTATPPADTPAVVEEKPEEEVFATNAVPIAQTDKFTELDPDTRLFLDNVSLSLSPSNGFISSFGKPLDGNGTLDLDNTSSTPGALQFSFGADGDIVPTPGEEDAIEYLDLKNTNAEETLQMQRSPSTDEALGDAQAKLEGNSNHSGLHRTKSTTETNSEDIARKARESIYKAKEEDETKIDIELVEELLQELLTIKDDMREISTKYTAFRRASRSAFEGFSMARQEYDREVAARREAEKRMDELKLQLVEQALRLVSLNTPKAEADVSLPNTENTRTESVKDMSEIQSQIQVLMEQKSVLSKISSSDTTESSMDDVKQLMETQMALLKASHEGEIAEMIQRKTELSGEVQTLTREKESLLKELDVLRTSLMNSTALTHASSTHSNLSTSESKSLIHTAAVSPSNENGPSSVQITASPQLTSQTVSSKPSLPTSASPSRKALSMRSDTGSTSTLSNLAHTTTNTAKRVHVTKLDPHSEAHVSTNVVRKFKWGKGKTDKGSAPLLNVSQEADLANANGSNEAAPDSVGSAPAPEAPNVTSHLYNPVSILRPVRCDHCGDKMWGLSELRCGMCGSYLHSKCLPHVHALKTPCPGSSGAGNPQDDATIGSTAYTHFGGSLISQVKAEPGCEVPLIVRKCIAAVAAHGMEYEGIYRKTGGMGQTKLITQMFERGQTFDLEDQDKFNDIAAVTSCLKNYFRTLPDPLFTHELHEEFVGSVSSTKPVEDGTELVEIRLQSLEKALASLPKEHYNTISYLFTHLHQISLQAAENKMTPSNLGVVFGPTLLRSSDPAREFSDTGLKAKVVELLVTHHDRLFQKTLN